MTSTEPLPYTRESYKHDERWSDKAVERVAFKFGITRGECGGLLVEAVTEEMRQWVIDEAFRGGGCEDLEIWVERVGIEFFIRMRVTA